MACIFIGYASAHGKTRAAAESLAERLRKVGHDVRLADLVVDPPETLTGVDAVVLGSWVHRGRHDRAMCEFARRHRNVLLAVPAGFFSVCDGAGEHAVPMRDASDHAARLFSETGWHPDHIRLFAGALRFGKHGGLLRTLAKRLAGRLGGAADTSTDYDYSDWKEVTEFAWEMADAARSHEPALSCIA